MKVLQYNFGHSVKGKVIFFNKTNPVQKHTRLFDTQSGHCNICIEDLPKGQWKAFVEWEYDGKDYFYMEEFEID